MEEVEQSDMQIWYRKALPKIYGGKKVEGMWQIRTNKELKQLFGIVEY